MVIASYGRQLLPVCSNHSDGACKPSCYCPAFCLYREAENTVVNDPAGEIRVRAMLISCQFQPTKTREYMNFTGFIPSESVHFNRMEGSDAEWNEQIDELPL